MLLRADVIQESLTDVSRLASAAEPALMRVLTLVCRLYNLYLHALAPRNARTACAGTRVPSACAASLDTSWDACMQIMC